MTAAVRLALEIRRRFSRVATAEERACYDIPPARLPVGVVILNDVPLVLEYDPGDREAIEAMGAKCA
jgi:hypothetical protein